MMYDIYCYETSEIQDLICDCAAFVYENSCYVALYTCSVNSLRKS